jgi:hypothetical protein
MHRTHVSRALATGIVSGTLGEPGGPVVMVGLAVTTRSGIVVGTEAEVGEKDSASALGLLGSPVLPFLHYAEILLTLFIGKPAIAIVVGGIRRL